MSKIGVIFAAWQCADLLPQSLAPWIEARKRHLGGRTYMIVAVSVPFEGFPQEEPLDGTLPVLHAKREQGDIDHHIQSVVPVKETEARGAALKWLVEQGCEATIMVDSDEFYQLAEIERIFAFVAARPHLACFRISLKNRVFDAHTHLVEPFQPMRIHRVQVGDLRATDFWDDNNIYYSPSSSGHLVKDVQLPGAVIPTAVAWIDHLSWLNDGPDGRSRRKILYQNARPGWKCSFDWDDARGGLIWRDGQPIPETARD